MSQSDWQCKLRGGINCAVSVTAPWIMAAGCRTLSKASTAVMDIDIKLHSIRPSVKNQLSGGKKKKNPIQVSCYCFLWKKKSINLDVLLEQAASLGYFWFGLVQAKRCRSAGEEPSLAETKPLAHGHRLRLCSPRGRGQRQRWHSPCPDPRQRGAQQIKTFSLWNALYLNCFFRRMNFV